MFIDISLDSFKHIFEQAIFHLPKRWDGEDFRFAIEKLFKCYCSALKNAVGSIAYDDYFGAIDTICDGIIKSIGEYCKGYPSKAFDEFSKVMKILMEYPFKTYQKTGWGEFFKFNDDPLNLFRVRNVQQNIQYSRSDIFHTPYNLRSKVASCRYSIAGYPSLYLGTSLELCIEESKKNSLSQFQIASRYKLVRNQRNHNTSIKVIELAVKPQDFIRKENHEINNYNRVGRWLNELNLNTDSVRSAYILWYPLIAVCSYIRVSKADSFAAEYIIPQLMMQWIRCQYEKDELFGVRYFSCASERASEMGFNYVFPVSGARYKVKSQYCAVLAKSFTLTVPQYIDEYHSWRECERALIDDSELDYI